MPEHPPACRRATRRPGASWTACPSGSEGRTSAEQREDASYSAVCVHVCACVCACVCVCVCVCMCVCVCVE